MRDWWCGPDARVYQFIGQDNLYFYGVAQPALWMALESGNAEVAYPQPGDLQQTMLIANHHILFGKVKASSSGAVKPPRLTSCSSIIRLTSCAHWLGLGLDVKSVGFKPKPFEVDEAKRNDPRVADPCSKEGALLTNVFNRLARSCFTRRRRTSRASCPFGAPAVDVVARCHKAMAEYEAIMHKAELHSVMTLMDDFIRWAQKHWADGIKGRRGRRRC